MKGRDELLWKYHITDTHGRGYGLGKRIQVYYVIVFGQGKESLHRLRGYGKLGTVVGFDNKTRPFIGPADIFVPLGRSCGDAAGETAVRCSMQNIGSGCSKCITVDSIFGKR